MNKTRFKTKAAQPGLRCDYHTLRNILSNIAVSKLRRLRAVCRSFRDVVDDIEFDRDYLRSHRYHLIEMRVPSDRLSEPDVKSEQRIKIDGWQAQRDEFWLVLNCNTAEGRRGEMVLYGPGCHQRFRGRSLFSISSPHVAQRRWSCWDDVHADQIEDTVMASGLPIARVCGRFREVGSMFREAGGLLTLRAVFKMIVNAEGEKKWFFDYDHDCDFFDESANQSFFM